VQVRQKQSTTVALFSIYLRKRKSALTRKLCTVASVFFLLSENQPLPRLLRAGLLLNTMKPHLTKLLAVWALILLLGKTYGQTPPVVPADTTALRFMDGDTMPVIGMKFEPAILLPLVVFPASILFLGWQSYSVHGVKKLSPRLIEPYLLATGNQQIIELQRRFRHNRKIWYGATAGGLVLWTVGMVQGVNMLLGADTGGGAGAFLFLGTATMLGGQVARVLGFQSLRRAVNLYNHQYTGRKPRVSMQLGAPSTQPSGAALYLKF
jgi:hypothetical protein